MAKQFQAFTIRDAKRIADVVVRVEGAVNSLPGASETQPKDAGPTVFLTGSGIAAISGTTLGSGVCTRYRVTGAELTATDDVATVYNLFGSAIGGSKYIIAVPINGIWVAIAEDCS